MLSESDALKLLWSVWANPKGLLSLEDAERLEQHRQGEEMPLQTCARLAGVRADDIPAFAHHLVASRCLDRAKAAGIALAPHASYPTHCH